MGDFSDLRCVLGRGNAVSSGSAVFWYSCIAPVDVAVTCLSVSIFRVASVPCVQENWFHWSCNLPS